MTKHLECTTLEQENQLLKEKYNMAAGMEKFITFNNNNNGYFKMLFLQRAHSPFTNKSNNGVNIE